MNKSVPALSLALAIVGCDSDRNSVEISKTEQNLYIVQDAFLRHEEITKEKNENLVGYMLSGYQYDCILVASDGDGPLKMLVHKEGNFVFCYNKSNAEFALQL
jgi:hypothetical protein